jgi:diaminopimelate decarboxylase
MQTRANTSTVAANQPQHRLECGSRPRAATAEWPDAFEHDGDRYLFDGCDLEVLANRFGTPVWVLALAVVEENYRACIDAWRTSYPRVECAFSLKANHLLVLIRRLTELGSSFDCTGETEMQIALAAGVAPSRLIVNGNGKSDRALELAALLGARQVNLDSMGEVARLERFAKRHGSVVDCAVRVQLDYERLLAIDPSFESMLKIWEGKFGAMVNGGEAGRVVEAVASSSYLRFVGLHHHVGFSAVTGEYDRALDVSHHREATRELCEFAVQLGVPIERLDIGGGFPVGRAISVTAPGGAGDSALHDLPPLREYAEAVSSMVQEHFPEGHEPLLQLETGRYQVQDAALLLARVTDVKATHGSPPRRVVTVDSSMQQFTQFGFAQTQPRPVVLRPRDTQTQALVAQRVLEVTDVVGQTCVYDTFAEAVPLEGIVAGDLVIVPTHGAYTDVSGTNFNAMPRPATVVVQAGRAALAKRHETLMDVLSRHVGPALDWSAAR